jgi:hypothetical protein
MSAVNDKDVALQSTSPRIIDPDLVISSVNTSFTKPKNTGLSALSAVLLPASISLITQYSADYTAPTFVWEYYLSTDVGTWIATAGTTGTLAVTRATFAGYISTATYVMYRCTMTQTGKKTLISTFKVDYIVEADDELTIVQSRPTVYLPANYLTGVVSSFNNTGNLIQVFFGNTPLLYNATTTTVNTFRITARTISPAAAVTMPTHTSGGSIYVTDDITAMTSDYVTVTYTVSVSDAASNELLYTVVQEFRKVRGISVPRKAVNIFISGADVLTDAECNTAVLTDTGSSTKSNGDTVVKTDPTLMLLYTKYWKNGGWVDKDTVIDWETIATNIGNIQNIAENFNTRNDRLGTALINPVLADSASTFDYTLSTDGSVNISMEWTWPSGVEAEIDGFIVYVYDRGITAPVSFYTISAATIASNPSITSFYVTPEKRAFIFYGYAANRYYSFGIRAYRIVDRDVDPDGVIFSAVVQPLESYTLANTVFGAWRASSTVSYAGDVTGTLDSVPVATVVSNAQTAITLLTGITSDGQITAGGEKSAFLIEYNKCVDEYAAMIIKLAQYNLNGGTPYTNYVNKYNALVSYVTGLPSYSDVAVTTAVTGTTLRTRFTEYYETRDLAINTIDNLVTQTGITPINLMTVGNLSWSTQVFVKTTSPGYCSTTLPLGWSVYSTHTNSTGKITATTTATGGAISNSPYVRISLSGSTVLPSPAVYGLYTEANIISPSGLTVLGSGVANSLAIKTSTNYMVSFYARKSSAGTATNVTCDFPNFPLTTVTGIQTPTLSTSWQRYVYRIYSTDATGPDEILFSSILSLTAYFDISNIQVEIGGVCSSYKESPLGRASTYQLAPNSATNIDTSTVSYNFSGSTVTSVDNYNYAFSIDASNTSYSSNISAGIIVTAICDTTACTSMSVSVALYRYARSATGAPLTLVSTGIFGSTRAPTYKFSTSETAVSVVVPVVGVIPKTYVPLTTDDEVFFLVIVNCYNSSGTSQSVPTLDVYVSGRVNTVGNKV